MVFGKASGFAANLNLSTLDGSERLQASSDAAGDDVMRLSVSGAGDVNGDGFDDLLIGAIGANRIGPFGTGASYVIFGRGVELSVSDAAVSEGNAGTTALQFTVSLSEAGTVPVTVKVATANGSALANSDYTPLGATTLTFAPGETSKTITVEAIGDTLFENDETFSIVLSDATGGVIRDGTGLGTIRNDDAAPTVNIASASVVEGDSGTSSLTFTVSLSTASGLPATVEFASVDGTALAGSDYTALTPGTLTFAPGETSKTITVDVLGDTSIEDHERFSVVLLGARTSTIGTGTATGTILNDDTAIRISDSVSNLEGDSGQQGYLFTVSLEKPSALPVTVNFASADGTASAGSDYTALTPGTLTFAPGETSKIITVEVLGDATHETDETFSVVLSGPVNAGIAGSTATGTIRNDDAPPVITISNGAVVEGDTGTSNLLFTVSLSAPSGLPADFRYATADGTAVAGSDFTAPASESQITFAPGETSKTITIEVIGDASIEAHETFSLLLSDSANAAISGGTATGTILNDDTSLRITDATLLEGHSGTRPVIFTVSLTAASALPVTVNFMSADETATAGSDYTALAPGTLTFAPGETSKILTVDVIGDTVVEPTEAFSVILSGAVNATIDDGAGAGTILDDDLTIVGKRKATFTDADGDLVTIKVSKGTLKVEDFTLFPSGLGSQLALVDFSGKTEFAGANLSITAKRPAGTTGGAGLVHVGTINAAGIDLGNVVVQGDLGQIDAGDDLTPQRGLLSLSANSLGRFGLATQLPGGSLQSDITGALKTLTLADGMHDAALFASGDIGSVTIKGDVLGSAIRSDGKIEALKISGDLAASATSAAMITARGTLAPASLAKALAIGGVSIGGSVEHAQILAGYDRRRGGGECRCQHRRSERRP